MTENKETKKKQPKVAALPSEVNVNVNFNWGVLASEVRSLIEEFRDKDYSTPVNVDHKVSQESLDVLLAEVTNRMKAEMSPEEGNRWDKNLTPFTTFVKTFAGYGFPSNIIVDRISFGYSLEELQAYINGERIEVKLENDDIKKLVDVKDDATAKHALALELFPKYFKNILMRESFYSYNDYEDDYSKYVVPEGVDITDITLSLNEISATVNGEFKTTKLQPVDYIATLCFDINGYRIPRATAEQLVVKYFLTEKKEKKYNVPVKDDIYIAYLKEKLEDMKSTVYRDTPTVWLAVHEFAESLSIKDNKIVGEVASEDRLSKIDPILTIVKYMFFREYNVNLSDVPNVDICVHRESKPEGEEQDKVGPMIEEQETTRHRGFRR